MVGTFWIDSVSALWAMPPVLFANQRAACAGGREVDRVGPLGVLLGLQPHAAAEQLALRLQVHRGVDASA